MPSRPVVAFYGSLLVMKQCWCDTFTRAGMKVGATLLAAIESMNVAVRAPVGTAPGLMLSSGPLEALKWLALLLMTPDHVN